MMKGIFLAEVPAHMLLTDSSIPSGKGQQRIYYLVSDTYCPLFCFVLFCQQYIVFLEIRKAVKNKKKWI